MALHIFLVEDNKTIRDNLIPTLEDLIDAHVVGVPDSEKEAVDWLASHPDAWEMAVVDLFLREGTGLGVLRRAPRRTPGQRMVVLSNYATREMRARCLAAGADAVFDKSNELEDFIAYCHAGGGQP